MCGFPKLSNPGSRFARRMLGVSVLIGAMATTASAGRASAAVTVFLDFGSATDTATKDDQRILNRDGTALLTLQKGARLGFVPTDLGYGNNDNRAALIGNIVDQVRLDYRTAANAAYNITFVTDRPAAGDFSTLSLVTGGFPNFNAPLGDNSIVFNFGTGRATIMGGALDGYYVRLTDGQLFKANGTAVEGETIPTIVALRPARTLGIAQGVDVGNRRATDRSWAFVGSHGATAANLTSDQRRVELANTVSHEVGHLLGLDHADGAADTLMDGAYDGTDKGFGAPEHRILAGPLASKVPVQPRKRDAKSGDSDSHGTGKGPDPGSSAPLDDQAAWAFRSMRTQLTTLVPYDVILPVAETYATDPEDGAYTDRLLSNGTTAQFTLTVNQPGVQVPLYAAWIEIDAMNIADTLGGANDMKLFLDGMEMTGAFDGIDQRGTVDDPSGYAHSGVLKFFLDDYFSVDTLNLMLADSTLQMTMLVNGASSGVSIDQVRLVIVDAPEPGTLSIPTVSEWGLIILALLLLIAATIIFAGRRVAAVRKA